jgi:aminomethyltransferase
MPLHHGSQVDEHRVATAGFDALLRPVDVNKVARPKPCQHLLANDIERSKVAVARPLQRHAQRDGRVVDDLIVYLTCSADGQSAAWWSTPRPRDMTSGLMRLQSVDFDVAPE